MKFGLFVVGFLLFASLGDAAEKKLSIVLTVGYTELDGAVEFQSTITPFVLSSPTNFLTPFVPGDPIEVGTPMPFDTDDISWELALNYRMRSWLQIQGGYVDFGSFESVRPEFAFVATPPIIGVPLPPGLMPVSPPTGFLPTSLPSVTLDASGWFLGAKVDHAITPKTRVYARLASLRVTFDAKDTFGDFLDVHDPSGETGWLWGVGAQYAVWPRLLIGVGYTQYDVKLQRLDSYQLSLEFLTF